MTSVCFDKSKEQKRELSGWMNLQKEPYFHFLLVTIKEMLNAILEIVFHQPRSTKSWGQRYQHNQPLKWRRQRTGERGIWSNGSFQSWDHSTRRRRDRPQHQALADVACLRSKRCKLQILNFHTRYSSLNSFITLSR